MIRKVLKYLVIFLSMFIFTSGTYLSWLVYDARNVQFKMTISNWSTGNTYFFRLRYDGTFEVLHGRTNHDSFERVGYMGIRAKRERLQLTRYEHTYLISLAEELNSHSLNHHYTGRIFVWGSYKVEIWYDDLIYGLLFGGFDYGEANHNFKELVEKVISLSPMTIYIDGEEL